MEGSRNTRGNRARCQGITETGCRCLVHGVAGGQRAGGGCLLLEGRCSAASPTCPVIAVASRFGRGKGGKPGVPACAAGGPGHSVAKVRQRLRYTTHCYKDHFRCFTDRWHALAPSFWPTHTGHSPPPGVFSLALFPLPPALASPQVPIYVLDVRDRTFDIWSIARASPPDQQATTDADAKASARRRLLRGSLAAAAAAAGGGGGGGGGQSMSLSELSAAATSGAIKDPEAALAAAAAAAKAAAGGGEGVEVEGAGAGAETRSPEERWAELRETMSG